MTVSVIALSRDQARRLALSGQGFGGRRFGRGRAGTRRAIEHLGYVQIDTISVVERAHHHTLFNRVAGYRREHLDQLIEDRSVLEYWAHAAAYLPMADYRFCLPRMNDVAERKRHWFDHDDQLVREILARIRAEGAVRAGDFESHVGTRGMWQWSPVKRAIEFLFMQGTLLVTRRENFQKVVDLAERVVPENVDTTTPTEDEYGDYLVDRFMRVHGIAHLSELGYLRRNTRASIQRTLSRQIEDGQLLRASVRGVDATYVIPADFEDRLSQRIARQRAVILSPFDNLVIQRDRVQRLFAFDYQLECYVPRKKRRHGYFCLPILWQGRLVARLDAKCDRQRSVLVIHRVFLERGLRQPEGFARELVSAIRELAQFNDCHRLEVSDAWSEPFARILRTTCTT